jgi:hypothetical protein
LILLICLVEDLLSLALNFDVIVVAICQGYEVRAETHADAAREELREAAEDDEMGGADSEFFINHLSKKGQEKVNDLRRQASRQSERHRKAVYKADDSIANRPLF